MSTGGAFVGRDIVVSFSLNQSTTVVPNDFKRLGAVRGKEFGPEWDTIDVTADDSPQNLRENLATFVKFDVSLDGISREEEIKNQDEIEDYVISPTNDQPCGWLRIVRPSKAGTKTFDVPVIFTNFRTTGPYDDGVTWSMDSISNGAITTTYA
jgi:predicted secreted protein